MTTKGNGAGPEGRPGEAPIRTRPSDGRPADMSSSPPPVTGPSGRTGPGFRPAGSAEPEGAELPDVPGVPDGPEVADTPAVPDVTDGTEVPGAAPEPAEPREVAVIAGVNLAEIELIVAGVHHDPHSILGAHPGPGGYAIRTLRPFAAAVAVVLEDGRR